MRFAFIEAEKASFPVSLMCRVLQVSRSGYYAWRTRPQSQRAQQDVQLVEQIRRVHQDSGETYGSPRIRAELVEEGVCIGRKRVARLMRTAGISARVPRRFQRTTDSNHDLPTADNVLDRDFTASNPNEAWVTDITYVRTWEGWLYLAVIIDLFSRRVVGWAIDDHMRTELITEALRMALGRRLPKPGLVHHSDRGCQYASATYRALLAEHGLVCSMSKTGDCWDNAVAESFFGTLKTELIYRRPWPTKRETKTAISHYIELFYNSQRRHSTLGYTSPASFERMHLAMATKAA